MPEGIKHDLFMLLPPCDRANGLQMWDTGQDLIGLEGGRRLGSYAITKADAPAGLFGVKGCWGSDRMALYYSNYKPAIGAPPTPPLVEIEIRGGADGIQNVITTLSWQPTAYEGSMDLVVQVCARLVTQWEVWARISEEGFLPMDVSVNFRMLIDRSGGCRDARPALQPGPNATITFPVPPGP